MWMRIGICLCIAAAIVFLLSAVWVWYTHWRLRRIMEHMDRMLGAAMEGRFKEQVYDESMLSSIETKLAHYLAASETAGQKLKDEKEKVKQLIADISHQTKTPVANLLLYIQMLEERELPKEESEFVRELDSQAQKLNFLIASLVKASRLETGMLVLQPKWNRLSPMLEDVLAQAAPQAERKQLELIPASKMICQQITANAKVEANHLANKYAREYKFVPNGLQAYFDRKWTAEAVYNIVDNAVKYTPEGGKIIVEVLDMEMFVRIEVRDNGIGIPEDETAKVFQRFYRGASANGQEGLGIGLYLSRQIIAGEDGYIKVKSKEGEGSSFFIYLPKSFKTVRFLFAAERM